MRHQVALLIRYAGKQLMLYAVILFVAASFSLYVVLNYQTGFAGRRIEFETNIPFADSARADANNASLPDALKKLSQEKADALDQMAAATSDAELIRAASKSYDADLRMYRAGYLVSDGPSLRLAAELFDGMSQLDHPQAYDESSQLPAVLILSFISAYVPHII